MQMRSDAIPQILYHNSYIHLLVYFHFGKLQLIKTKLLTTASQRPVSSCLSCHGNISAVSLFRFVKIQAVIKDHFLTVLSGGYDA